LKTGLVCHNCWRSLFRFATFAIGAISNILFVSLPGGFFAKQKTRVQALRGFGHRSDGIWYRVLGLSTVGKIRLSAPRFEVLREAHPR
jgi:hypothetical protein